MTPRAGASFIAFPRDVQGAATEASVPPSLPLPPLGAAPEDMIRRAAEKISKAKSPVVLLGMGASEPGATAAVRALLKRHALLVVGTFQGAGAISRELLPLFFGRVGLFRNQPGDKLLARNETSSRESLHQRGGDLGRISFPDLRAGFRRGRLSPALSAAG